MLNQKQIEQLNPRIQSFRLVFAALIAGVAIFAVIVIALGGLEFDSSFSMLSLIVFGLSALIGVQGIVLPRLVGIGSIKQMATGPDQQKLATDDEKSPVSEKILGVWFTSTLIGVAMLESAAFLNLVAAMIEKNAWHLVVAGLFLAVMVIYFPTSNRIVGWIESRLNDLQRST